MRNPAQGLNLLIGVPLHRSTQAPEVALGVVEGLELGVGLEFTVESVSTELHAVNEDKFSVGLDQARVQFQGFLELVFGLRKPLTSKLDLSSAHPGETAERVGVRNLLQVSKGLFGLTELGLGLRAYHEFAGRERLNLLEIVEGPFELLAVRLLARLRSLTTERRRIGRK